MARAQAKRGLMRKTRPSAVWTTEPLVRRLPYERTQCEANGYGAEHAGIEMHRVFPLLPFSLVYFMRQGRAVGSRGAFCCSRVARFTPMSSKSMLGAMVVWGTTPSEFET